MSEDIKDKEDRGVRLMATEDGGFTPHVAPKPWIVLCTSGRCLLGYSSGPHGNIIRLEDPLQYMEVLSEKGQLSVGAQPVWRAVVDCTSLQVRWEGVCGPNDMTPESQANLTRMLEDVKQRVRMARSGLVTPNESMPSKDIVSIDRKLRKKE